MNFSNCLDMLKLGYRMTRTGWNGRGMFVVLQKGYPQGIPCNKQTAEVWGIKEGDLFRCNPYFQIKNVDGSHSMWIPSVGDLLAEDWEVCVFDEIGEAKKLLLFFYFYVTHCWVKATYLNVTRIRKKER